uniref:Uncharacterized protein n=1 Tax=Abalone asfa-like virus TaxID=2839893 RepID=A0A5K7XWY6_9VIRU|nr:hypothetical protein [Abalone asfa-like virus]
MANESATNQLAQQISDRVTSKILKELDSNDMFKDGGKEFGTLMANLVTKLHETIETRFCAIQQQLVLIQQQLDVLKSQKCEIPSTKRKKTPTETTPTIAAGVLAAGAKATQKAKAAVKQSTGSQQPFVNYMLWVKSKWLNDSDFRDSLIGKPGTEKYEKNMAIIMANDIVIKKKDKPEFQRRAAEFSFVWRELISDDTKTLFKEEFAKLKDKSIGETAAAIQQLEETNKFTSQESTKLDEAVSIPEGMMCPPEGMVCPPPTPEELLQALHNNVF